MKLAWLTVAVVSLGCFQVAEARRWTDSSGSHSLEADFVAAAGDSVVLKKPDNSFLVLPLAKLSDVDQEHARQAAKVGGKPADSSNGAPGLEVTGNGLTSAQKKQFTTHLLSQFSVEVKPLSSPALAGVVQGNVIKATIKREVDGGFSTEEQLVVYDGEKFSSLPQPSTDGELPALLQLIDKSYKLKTMADATKLEAVLDALYEANNFRGKKATEIKQSGNQWIFVRGKFFEKEKGFILTTDDDGSIQKVEYSLKIE